MQGHGPLASVRVLDISERSTAAAVAGMVMSQFGAEVIRVEPRGGNPIRALPAARVWLAGNRSVVVGEAEVANGAWARLLDSADVVLTTAHPTTDKPSGLLDGMRPDQIKCVLTARPATPETAGSGTDGLPVYGELIEAELGFQHSMADLFGKVHDGAVGHPVYLAWPHAEYGAAWLMLLGTLGALIQRARSGGGQTVTTSLADGLAALSPNLWMHGDAIEPIASGSAYPNEDSDRRFLFGLHRTTDGWVFLHTGPVGSFNRLLAAMGRNDLVAEPKTTSIMGDPMRLEDAREMRAQLRDRIAVMSIDEAMDFLVPTGVAVMPSLPPGEALKLEQIRANGMAITEDGITRVGRTATYARTPTRPGGAVPEVGADAALFSEARQRPALRAPAHARPADAGPLDGITVVDFGSYIAGPYADRVFADLGARVIKVEALGGDPMRIPYSVFGACNRGKYDVGLNLKTEAGKAAALDLIRGADIVHHNMRNGVMERLGLDEASVRQNNPGLVYSHSSGYGNEGPWALRPAFEPLHSGLAGLLHRATGEGNNPQMYMSHMDWGGGLCGAVATLAGLYAREVSGEGQFMEAPQLASALLAMSDVFIENGEIVQTFALDRQGRGVAPTNAVYDTADDHVVVSCNSEAEWRGLGQALGLTALPGYAEARLDSLNNSRAGEAIQSALRVLPTAAALRKLKDNGVAATVPRPPDFHGWRDAETEALGIFATGEHPVMGTVHELAQTIRFSAASGRHNRPAPEIGQDSIEVLEGIGRSRQAIEAMVEAGATAVFDYPRKTAAE